MKTLSPTIDHSFWLLRLVAPHGLRLRLAAAALSLAPLAAASLLLLPVQAQSQTVRYQILSGEYVMVGGIWGSWTNRLPNSEQSLVELTTGLPGGSASARVLGANGTSVALALVNGAQLGSQLRFHYVTNAPNYPLNPNPALLDYTLLLGSNSLSLAGSIQSQSYGADIPYGFFYYAVQAVPLPDLCILPAYSGDVGVSTNSVFPGEVLGVHWRGHNNATACVPEIQCVERFGPASGPWQDGVFLFNDTTNFLIGNSTFSGSLAIGGAYTNQGSFVIPTNTTPGLYGVEIRIDYLAGNTNGAVREQDETNNVGRVPNLVAVLPRLSFTGIQRLDDHTVRVQVRGAVTEPVRIQTSKSASGGAWTDLTNAPAFRGVIEYLDVTATNSSCFYRVLSP